MKKCFIVWFYFFVGCVSFGIQAEDVLKSTSEEKDWIYAYFLFDTSENINIKDELNAFSFFDIPCKESFFVEGKQIYGLGFKLSDQGYPEATEPIINCLQIFLLNKYQIVFSSEELKEVKRAKEFNVISSKDFPEPTKDSPSCLTFADYLISDKKTSVLEDLRKYLNDYKGGLYKLKTVDAFRFHRETNSKEPCKFYFVEGFKDTFAANACLDEINKKFNNNFYNAYVAEFPTIDYFISVSDEQSNFFNFELIVRDGDLPLIEKQKLKINVCGDILGKDGNIEKLIYCFDSLVEYASYKGELIKIVEATRPLLRKRARAEIQAFCSDEFEKRDLRIINFKDMLRRERYEIGVIKLKDLNKDETMTKLREYVKSVEEPAVRLRDVWDRNQYIAVLMVADQEAVIKIADDLVKKIGPSELEIQEIKNWRRISFYGPDDKE